MTDDQIEDMVQYKVQRLDMEYHGTHMSAMEYYNRLCEIQAWARVQYGIPAKEESE